jgi:hypothetical protein
VSALFLLAPSPEQMPDAVRDQFSWSLGGFLIVLGLVGLALFTYWLVRRKRVRDHER